MATSDQISSRPSFAPPVFRAGWDSAAYPAPLPLALVAIAFLLRLLLARAAYFNADEAQIYFISAQPSLAATYRAGLISAHPPLFYFLLHYWRLLGSSELVLRLPSALAGAGFCWLGFKWLDRIAGRDAALAGLLLFCFTPALVSLGAQVRQYSLLLLFFAAALYWLELALQKRSARAMALFSISLWLAILTQYSAWLFCLTVAVYALWRFTRRRPRPALLITWGGGQLVALASYAGLGFTQLPWLRQLAAVDHVFPGKQSLAFLPRQTFRLFHYLFSQPLVGGVVLLLFVVGIASLWRQPAPADEAKPSPRQLAGLLLLPLLFSWLAALAHLYPFDGTRHSIVPALFVIAGASLGLSALGRPASWNKPLFLAALLMASYAFARPLGPQMPARDQSRQRMTQAAHFLRQAAPPGSIFLVDDQSSYLFRYYFCREQGMSFTQVPWPFLYYDCGSYRATVSRGWRLTPEKLDLGLQRTASAYRLRPGDPVWLFQAGWGVDREPDLLARLRDYGCPASRRFGRNIRVCRLTIPQRPSTR